MYTLSYHSQNRIEDLTFDTLPVINDILNAARSRNAAEDITGALMFSEGRFTQILEGEEPAVKKIFDSIKRDPRHSGVTILATQTMSARRFRSWAMAFVGHSPAAKNYYNEFSSAPGLDGKTFDHDKLCQLMMKMLKADQNSMRPAMKSDQT